MAGYCRTRQEQQWKVLCPKSHCAPSFDQQEIQRFPEYVLQLDSFPTNTTADTGKGITDSFLGSGIGESQQ